MTSPAASHIAVVGAAIVDDLDRPRRMLAARRTEPAALAGGWELPGGKVDPGESELDALHRELREELGVEVRVGAEVAGPLTDGRWPLSRQHVIRVWLAQVSVGEVRPLEDHDELRWLERGQLDDVPWLAADRPIVAAVGDRLTA
ncbi:(deoxy)nucleoside triphosphate pyrophosphohydrolase [Arsenicicoccus sp. oral taxon 190]|uniref:(deoxy)nucleoside triphosphate pyrophosphohydrolase n=1 Tax=Arsenicicoccus sp. oral taxon 190 TaxID=1658671 RepID=UPI00067A2400|nr:(deoxy)nucleoside triphosphate pyrophosphohydrolase [Arsenicicoccus sp. oral taxon 190]AKT51362.1 DNA mismatch repair protein MutT [Arsenicicoccus sp. oral taxon 190]